MKTRFFCLVLTMFFSFSVYSQTNDITCKIGTGGLFKVTDNASTFLSLSQADGNITLSNCMVLPVTTSSSLGVIFKGTDRYIHNYYGSGTNGRNTFMGVQSGNFTLGGSSGQASYNTGTGYGTLSSLTNGADNTAFGYLALNKNANGSDNCAFGSTSMYKNIAGWRNSAFGMQSLINNTDGNDNTAIGYMTLNDNILGSYNTAVGRSCLENNTKNNNSGFGYYALYTNTTGTENSAFGYHSLRSNSSGFNNSAFGDSSLFSNTVGSFNTALGFCSLRSNNVGVGNTSVGDSSLYDNTEGLYNTAVGTLAGLNVTFGDYNTFLGYNAGSNVTSGSYNIAIGYNAQVPTTNGLYQLKIGDDNISYAGVHVAWTITSDARKKKNVAFSNLGLGFISKLNPVSYTRNSDVNEKVEYGLIAQEVERALKESGVENTGMITVDDNGYYELRYNDLIAPVIKAVQELKEENENLKNENSGLKERLTKLEQMQNILIKEISLFKASSK